MGIFFRIGAGVLSSALLGCGAMLYEGGVAPTSSQVISTQPVLTTFPGLDPGSGVPLQTLHFSIEAYGLYQQEKSAVVEKIYSQIMEDTNLYSFKPKENYRIVIYKDREEFLRKTGQPEWSGGFKYKNGAYTYQQGGVDQVLAHEITHIIFGEYLGEETKKHRWLNEGLAMHIDAQFKYGATYDDEYARWTQTIRNAKEQPPMQEIIEFRPYSEKSRDVNRWYQTVASLVAYLIKNSGEFSFSLLLRELKNGESINTALERAYPGKFSSTEELYLVWKSELGL